MYLGAVSGELGLSEVEKLSSIARRCEAGPDSVRPEGEYFVAVEPNAFGLPAIDTCPGRTAYCEQNCYAIGCEARSATAIKLKRNLDILLEDPTVEGMVKPLSNMMDRYRTRADRLGIDPNKRRFRIHWDGDFFSTDYAQAWQQVIADNPDIMYFVFTRSFQVDVNVLPVLSGLPNLDLFVSVDYLNVDRAAKVLPDFPDVRVAYLVDYADEAEPLVERLGRHKDAGFRHRACPENLYNGQGERQLPIISERGGACARCTYCISKPSNWDVVFVKEHLQTRPQGRFGFAQEVAIKPKGKTGWAANGGRNPNASQSTAPPDPANTDATLF